MDHLGGVGLVLHGGHQNDAVGEVQCAGCDPDAGVEGWPVDRFQRHDRRPTQTLLRRAIDSLLGVCPLPDQLYTLTVTDESGVTYTASVSIDGQILTKAQSATSVTFSLQLFAPDPRRFGPSHTATVQQGTTATGGVAYPVTYPVAYGTPGTTGSTQVTNNGTAYSDLVFTLNGPLKNPVIRHSTTGHQISYTGTIPSGAYVTIDTASGSCLYNGTQNYRAFLAPNMWFTLPAHSSITV